MSEVERYSEALQAAWGLLANVSGGDWEQQSSEWQEAMRRWRDTYLTLLVQRRAEKLYDELVVPSSRTLAVNHIAAALRQARREALEEAANEAEQRGDVYAMNHILDHYRSLTEFATWCRQQVQEPPEEKL